MEENRILDAVVEVIGTTIAAIIVSAKIAFWIGFFVCALTWSFKFYYFAQPFVGGMIGCYIVVFFKSILKNKEKDKENEITPPKE